MACSRRLGVLLQAAGQQSSKPRGHGRQRAPVGLLADDRDDDVGRVLTGKRPTARQHLEQDDAEGPDVGAAIHRLPARLLGAHVGSGAENDPGPRHRRRREGRRLRHVRRRTRGGLQGLGQAKVEHLHGAVRADFDVGGLQVTVDDPLLVRRLQRLRDLLRDRQRVVEGDLSARDPLRQVLALDQLHDQGTDAARFLQAVNVGDVGVIQRRQGLRFACEPSQPFGVPRKRVGQDLQRHVTIELRVACPKHLTHPSLADRRRHFVDADSGAASKGQGDVIIPAPTGSSPSPVLGSAVCVCPRPREWPAASMAGPGRPST